MLAFGDTAVTKIQLVESLERHAAVDAFIKGRYWSDGKGCAVGCSLHDFHAEPGDHAAYEPLFGIPQVLARLEDGIFEGLPIDAAKEWPLRFARAVRPGADLTSVWPKFAVWLLVDPEHGVIRYAKTDATRKAIQDVADGYVAGIEGRPLIRDEWMNLRRAAAAAADADAYAAAAAYAAYAAYAAAAAAAYTYADADAADAAYAAYAAAAAAYAADADADAADAAAYAADADADAAYADARQKARIAQADKLIELIEAA